MFFLLFLLDDRRIRIRIHISDQYIRIKEAQKHKNMFGSYGSGSATTLREQQRKIQLRDNVPDSVEGK
jgi:hypothetical protein